MAEQLSSPTTQAAPPASAAQRRRNRWIKIGLGSVAAAIVILLLWATWWAIQPGNQEYTRGARDVAIIFLAVLSVLIGIGVIALLYQVTMLTLLMRDEIKPLLESINETMSTVRGTAAFMSDHIAQPTIQVASAFAGVRRVFEALAGIRSNINPKQRKE